MSERRGLLTDRFDRALLYANQVQGGQTRKGMPIPYIAHLLGVASLVLEDGGDEDEAIAGLLHDSVEDQGGQPRLTDIRARFGDRVACIVDACTDADTIPKPEWRKRKEKYLRHLESVSVDALRVSAADKLHNARAILRDYRSDGEQLWGRFNGGREGTLWYYTELVAILTQRSPGSLLVEELERVVDELTRIAKEASPQGQANDP